MLGRPLALIFPFVIPSALALPRASRGPGVFLPLRRLMPWSLPLEVVVLVARVIVVVDSAAALPTTARPSLHHLKVLPVPVRGRRRPMNRRLVVLVAIGRLRQLSLLACIGRVCREADPGEDACLLLAVSFGGIGRWCHDTIAVRAASCRRLPGSLQARSSLVPLHTGSLRHRPLQNQTPIPFYSDAKLTTSKKDTNPQALN